jgi:predicted enzyme related to lactoylglutathione lyase
MIGGISHPSYMEVDIMEAIKDYTVHIDSKKRITLRGALYQYYNVKEYENGCIMLEPRELTVPDGISANTLKDMDRAIKFYEELFEQEVTERDELYSVFEVNGFRLGLFAYKLTNENHEFGSNCIPSFSVDDLKLLDAKLKGKDICFPITRIGNNWVAEFVDPEGNHIEMTAPAK